MIVFHTHAEADPEDNCEKGGADSRQADALSVCHSVRRRRGDYSMLLFSSTIL
jgi:hypothetical protein